MFMMVSRLLQSCVLYLFFILLCEFSTCNFLIRIIDPVVISDVDLHVKAGTRTRLFLCLML